MSAHWQPSDSPRSSFSARPAVAILSTGNEIISPGADLAPGQIYDINRFTLSAIVAEHGAAPSLHQTAQDTLDDLDRAIDACLASDVIVFSGGSSVGERDFILDVIGRRGEINFHGIALKPGKPTAFGVVQGKPVFGMPGYPASCLSNAYLLLVPALRRMAHLPPHRALTIQAPLAQRIVSTTGRHQFYTVRLVDGAAQPAFKASGGITLDVARRRLHRDPRADRHRRKRRTGRGEVVLERDPVFQREDREASA